MRPGQAAPDELRSTDYGAVCNFASMRPGQAAPDERPERASSAWWLQASMRPGQAAPDEEILLLQGHLYALLQ